MSGIGGLLRFDGGPVKRADLERMAAALRMHGPDRSDLVVAANVGLVHALMRLTPEDQFDRQPWRGPSGAVITADLRLDNRDEILARLGLRPEEALSWPDSRVVLAAWEALGDALWPRLRGPFAVAIWDPRARALTLARDPIGIKPLMWYRAGGFLAFATMPKGLFALPDVPRVLDVDKATDFLVLNHADHTTTVFRDIRRVAPAHVMTVRADGSVAQRRFWSAREVAPVRRASDADYAEGLREVLDRAVRRQLRSAHGVGFYLSGGLDSSAVVALASRVFADKGQRLAAFTQVPREGFDGPVPRSRYADETPYVEAIRAMLGNVDVTYVRNDACDDFADLERVFIAFEHPVRNPTNLGWILAILRLARAQNRRVMLGGALGNYTVSWSGWSQTPGHLLRGRLLTAFRQWRLFYERSSDSRFTAFRKLVVEPLAPDRLVHWVNRRRHGMAPWRFHSPVRPDGVDQRALESRARAAGHDFLYRFDGDERPHVLPPTDYYGDWLAAETALYGVEVRDPTADLDVVEYCLGVPPEQFLAEGIDRSLIRRAMWGLLPEQVLTNSLNGLQAADWFEKLEKQRGRLAADIAGLRTSPLNRQLLDVERLERALATWPEEGWAKREVVNEYHLALTRGVAAGRFLRWIESTN